MNWSYVAGYFDGEGHAGVYRDGGWRMGWTNTHKESLEAIHKFIGVGVIIERNPATNGGLGTKPIFNLEVRRVTDIRLVVPEMLPHCIVKHEALERILAHVADKPSRHENWGKLPRIGAEEIRRLYWDEGLSCGEIGEHLNVHGVTVDQFMRREGIPLRSQPEAQALAVSKNRARGRYSRGGFPMDGVAPKIIHDLYWSEGLCAREIGERYGLTREGMRAYMIRHDIPFRPRGSTNGRRSP